MEKIIDKIRKLLALSRDKGASEHEAATALAMAQRLMLEHDIKNVEEKRHISAVRGDWMDIERGERWENWIGGAVAKLFNCRHVIRGSLGSHQFVGKPENIEACQETLLWVLGQVDALYKINLKKQGGMSQGMRANFRRSFKEACAVRVHQRAVEIVAKSRNEIPAHMALVVIDQSLAEADELIAALPKARTKGVVRYGHGSAAGRAAGDLVQLQRTVK